MADRLPLQGLAQPLRRIEVAAAEADQRRAASSAIRTLTAAARRRSVAGSGRQGHGGCHWTRRRSPTNCWARTDQQPVGPEGFLERGERSQG
ncbi:hypothetical protein [Streptomyces sp. NPDC048442]|uniref:hypothetical protein n=1 Tax=Streptomyces sp. NPDC048442 TaxID=3154823 RepID=UPI003415713D